MKISGCSRRESNRLSNTKINYFNYQIHYKKEKPAESKPQTG